MRAGHWVPSLEKILEQRRPGKLVKRAAVEVSVRQIEIARELSMLDVLRLWRRFAGLPVLSRIEIAGEVTAAHAPRASA